jgi:hypothetical protein
MGDLARSRLGSVIDGPKSRSRASAHALRVVLAIALCGADAVAQHDSRAEQLFRDGRTAMQGGDCPTALRLLRESQQLDPAPGTLLNIGECEANVGEIVAAHRHLTEAAETFTNEEKRSFARDRAAAIGKRIARVTIRVAGAPAGTKVTVRDFTFDLASQPMPVLLDPGAVTFGVSAPRHRSATQMVLLREGDTLEVALGPLAREESAPRPAAVSSEERPSSGVLSPTLGWGLVGAGALGLAIGTITGILALERGRTVERECDSQYACNSMAGVDAGHSGETFATVSTIAIVAGVALAGAGLYIALTQRSRAAH